jgi:hypothetical protein
MAKTTVSPGQAYIQARQELASQGLDHHNIDKLISKSGLESILADVPALTTYFRMAASSLRAITDWDFTSKAVAGAVSGPESFREYYQNDVNNPVAMRDYIPAKYFNNPQLFVDDGILSPEQAQALTALLGNGPPPAADGEGTSGSGGGKNYGTAGGGGKAYSTGTKAYGTGTKAYGDNPPPTFSGGGGFSSTGGGNFEFGEFTTNVNMDRERNYINTLQGDPNYGLLQMVLGSEGDFRSVGASIVGQLQQVRAAKEGILTAMSNLDPTDPAQARKLTMLQNEMQNMGTSERELMDRMGIAQRTKDEMVSMIKSMMDVNFKTAQAIISNTK